MRKVLVIEDDLDICQMVTTHLQNLSFEVSSAVTVEEACTKLDRRVYEVLVTDLNLPDGTGFDVINCAHALKLNLKIIVMSAYDMEAASTLDKGVDYFIAKPFSLEAINEALILLHLLDT